MRAIKGIARICVALVTLLVGSWGAVAADVPWTRENAAHLLRRAAFGGTPEQIDAIHLLGQDAAVEYLISGKLPAGAEPVFEPVQLEEFKLDPPDPKADKKEEIKDSRQDLQAYRAYWVDRMLRTDRPLEEKMTLFWHGLLTSGIKEVKYGDFLIQQNQLFHRQALGNYKKLVDEIVHDAAMLRYLDADKNVVGKPNENLARELMELFTMGEGQGYTEKDIAQVARALTGMAVNQDKGVIFRRNKHDDGVKTIFGHSGKYGPDDVVELIFERPEPAKYLAKRLWQFFGQPSPTEEEIAPVAAALRQNNYEIKPALRVLFTSPAFYGERSKFALIKSPVELTVGTMRLLEQAPVAQPIALGVRQMGQELFQPPNVRGWPGGEQWITAATLYTRYNACAAMVEGALRGGGPERMKANENKVPKKVVPPVMNRKTVGVGHAFLSVVNEPSAGDQTGKPADRREMRREMKREGMKRPGAREARKDDGPAPVSPAALFPKLDATPSAERVVDAAIGRFLQRPLHTEKRAALVETLGKSPLKLGTKESDQRVRDMISLLLSTPEYQVQ
jgi:uncharacterized protein (DUF1800 family)